jgi:hypothetical protein
MSAICRTEDISEIEVALGIIRDTIASDTSKGYYAYKGGLVVLFGLMDQISKKGCGFRAYLDDAGDVDHIKKHLGNMLSCVSIVGVRKWAGG